MKILAILMLVLGYIALYFALHNHTQQYFIALLCFGMAFIMGLQTSVTDKQRKP